MKKLRYILISYIMYHTFLQVAFAQKITTLAPQVDRQSQSHIIITKVELTSDFTIIYYKYQDQANPLERFLNGRPDGPETIRIDPKSQLYSIRNIDKKYKFIKAIGIPVSPKYLEVEQGDMIKFSVYYERLDPGVEIFDVFEGKDDSKNPLFHYWNFYGIRIRNPKNQKKIVPTDIKTESKKIPPVAVQPPKPVEVKPEVVTSSVPAFSTLKGTILDAKTKQPISAKLSYSVPNDDNGVDSLQLSASAGKFKLILSPNQKYGYAASAKGYFPSSGEFDLTKTNAGQETITEILLSPVAVGEAVTLNNIYFQISKFDLLPTSYPQLDQLVKLLQDSPKAEIRIEGYTDSVGDFDENVKLSLDRANAVKKYLVSKGIDSAKIEAKGLGPTRPVSKGTTDAERQKNRRVEFVILKM